MNQVSVKKSVFIAIRVIAVQRGGSIIHIVRSCIGAECVNAAIRTSRRTLWSRNQYSQQQRKLNMCKATRQAFRKALAAIQFLKTFYYRWREMHKKLEIIHKHNRPYGIRDSGGFLFFFPHIVKFTGQESRYRQEIFDQFELADYLLERLKNRATEIVEAKTEQQPTSQGQHAEADTSAIG